MPLDKSGGKDAFKRNVSTLMGEVGKCPHVQSRKQALAIAYSYKRKKKKGGLVQLAEGGLVDEDGKQPGLGGDVPDQGDQANLIPMMPELPPEYLQTIEKLHEQRKRALGIGPKPES